MSLWRFVLRILCLLTLFGCLVCCLPSHGLVNGTELFEARQAPAGKLLTLADVTAPVRSFMAYPQSACFASPANFCTEKLLQLMCRKPGPGQCLFYTYKQGGPARAFVQQPNKLGLTMTIWVRKENHIIEVGITAANIDCSIRTRGRTSITT